MNTEAQTSRTKANKFLTWQAPSKDDPSSNTPNSASTTRRLVFQISKFKNETANIEEDMTLQKYLIHKTKKEINQNFNSGLDKTENRGDIGSIENDEKKTEIEGEVQLLRLEKSDLDTYKNVNSDTSPTNKDNKEEKTLY